jgi:hypothetical protein
MNYSRRQLEALGEPLGESVTRKEAGRTLYGSGGGGGGSAPAQQTTVSELPEWARPYAQKALAGAEAVTFQKDASGNITGLQPYQQYTGERSAQFTPLQKQAFEGAAGLGPSAATGAGIGMAQQAAQRAMGVGYDPYQTGQFSQQAGMYMSPFIQEALAPQMREAVRSSEMMRNADQARAVAQGAFGGSRQAIVEAERQRNLGTQLGDIQARGLQSAFDQARQQFNTEQQLREQSRQYGSGLGLQGLQTALQGAGQLGQLGSQQFGQQKEALGLQQQFGTQQQQRVQDVLSQQYQDFLNQQRYPYQQLEFLSSMVRGTPTGQVQTMYAPQPSTTNQLLGAGTSLAGAYMMGGGRFAEGGEVRSEAAGLADLALSKM